uniref:RRFamide n=1 Tax=Tripedalia cystophora TaxID=6141 RepID=A0A482A200_TRICY|nr:RRFamide [Tripedalia cystophora]
MKPQTQELLLLITLCISFQNGYSLENSYLQEAFNDANEEFLQCRDMLISSAVKKLVGSRWNDERTVENSDFQKKPRDHFRKRTFNSGNWNQEFPQQFHDIAGELEEIAIQIIAFCRFKILNSNKKDLDAFKRDSYELSHDEAKEKKSILGEGSTESSAKFLKADEPIWSSPAIEVRTKNDRNLRVYTLQELKETNAMIGQHLAAFGILAKKETTGLKPNRRRFGKREVISSASDKIPNRRRFGREVRHGSFSWQYTKKEIPREFVTGENLIRKETPRRRFGKKRDSETDYQRRRFGKRENNENYRKFASLPQNRRFGKREGAENYLRLARIQQNRRFGKRNVDDAKDLGNEYHGKALSDDRGKRDLRSFRRSLFHKDSAFGQAWFKRSKMLAEEDTKSRASNSKRTKAD